MECQLTRQLSGAERLAYDDFVFASASGHAAQSWHWAEMVRAYPGVEPLFAVVRDAGGIVGTALVQRPRALGVGLPWAWVERGPVVGETGRLPGVVLALSRALRREGVFRLRVMPYWAGDDASHAEAALRSIGLRDVQTADGPHAVTLRLALGGEALFRGKSTEQVRWRSRQAERAGAAARRGAEEDWASLRAMHGKLMQSQGRKGKPDRFWYALRRFVSDARRGALFACDYEGRTVAAAVVLRHGGLATYAWGASIPEKLPFSKAIPALVAAIHWARDEGCHTFDLGGVPLQGDDDPKRAAIATFKYDFDKKRVHLVREHGGWC